jgi:hypoxanthine phosphoribosyltransferase
MKTLLEPDQIQRGIVTLAQRLDSDYAGQPLTLVALLDGAIVFLADLMRKLKTPIQIATLRVSSYRGTATVPGEVQLREQATPQVSGRHILLIDDIFDTGQTLDAVARQVADCGALSVRTAVLLWKSARSKAGRSPDYFAFEIPDVFVVGFGLDYNGNHRQLPHIAMLESQDLETTVRVPVLRLEESEPTSPGMR